MQISITLYRDGELVHLPGRHSLKLSDSGQSVEIPRKFGMLWNLPNGRGFSLQLSNETETSHDTYLLLEEQCRSLFGWIKTASWTDSACKQASERFPSFPLQDFWVLRHGYRMQSNDGEQNFMHRVPAICWW